jgi:hypothetical protein
MGGVFVVNIQHDDWCDLVNGRGECNCEPEISQERLRGAEHLRKVMEDNAALRNRFISNRN